MVFKRLDNWVRSIVRVLQVRQEERRSGQDRRRDVRSGIETKDRRKKVDRRATTIS